MGTLDIIKIAIFGNIMYQIGANDKAEEMWTRALNIAKTLQQKNWIDMLKQNLEKLNYTYPIIQ